MEPPFGRGGFEACKATGQKLGFEIVAEERHARGAIDFTAQLGHIKASPAQALVEWSRYAEAALVARHPFKFDEKGPRPSPRKRPQAGRGSTPSAWRHCSSIRRNAV